MTGQDLIDWIRSNNMQEAIVEVSAIIQYDGDHENLSTKDIGLQSWDNNSLLSIYIGDTLS